jgi:hypothetical protein
MKLVQVIEIYQQCVHMMTKTGAPNTTGRASIKDHLFLIPGLICISRASEIPEQ